MPRELSELGQLALGAASRGSAVALERRASFAVRHKSSSRDLVTDVDTAAEEAVLRHIRRYRPHDPVLAEESGQSNGSGGVRWIIDPIDGTANFARGRADYAVAVAAEVEGRPAAAAIVKPVTGEWIACDETGVVVCRDGQVPGASSPAGLFESLVCVSVSLDEARRGVTLATLTRLLPEVQDFRRTGSTSCELFAVATGQLDAYIGIGTQPWDIAAGWAVINAAGGRCERFPVATGHDAFVLGSPAVVGELATIVRDQAAVYAETHRAPGRLPAHQQPTPRVAVAPARRPHARPDQGRGE